MRTDVRTLIGALTTERDSLTKAIAVLQELERGASPERAVATVTQRARKPKGRQRLDAESKHRIGQRMLTASTGSRGALGAEARRCARDFGGSAVTIAQQWKAWAGVSSANGQSHDETPMEMATPV